MDQLVALFRTLIFGPFLVLAFLAGTFVFWKKGSEEYYDQSALLDAVILSAFWGLVGARLGFVLAHFPDFGLDIFRWFSLFAYPGYVGMAGILGGLLSLIVSARRQKWNVYETIDFAAVGLSVSLMFIQIGMFLNGSGFGNPTTLPFGMSFPGVFDKRHPVQLYAAVLYIALFIALWKLESIYRTFLWYRSNKRTAQPGFLLSCFLIGYGGIGVVLAFFQPSFVKLYGMHVEGVLRGLVAVAGGILLYMRSGHTLFVFKKKNFSLHTS